MTLAGHITEGDGHVLEPPAPSPKGARNGRLE